MGRDETMRKITCVSLDEKFITLVKSVSPAGFPFSRAIENLALIGIDTFKKAK